MERSRFSGEKRPFQVTIFVKQVGSPVLIFISISFNLYSYFPIRKQVTKQVREKASNKLNTTTMTLHEIFTAIEFSNEIDDDVRSTITQPLLIDEISMGDDEAQGSSTKPETVKVPGPMFVVLGVITGFLIQVISLGAYAFMLTHYGEIPSSSSESDWVIYGLLSVLTQVDLVIYVLIWVAFTCTMTRPGMAFIRLQYQTPVKRRSVFVLGVYFLVGIVLGAFLAWSMIDVYLGFPIPFTPIAATVLVDLILCYLMVFCYDMGREESIEEEDITACC